MNRFSPGTVVLGVPSLIGLISMGLLAGLGEQSIIITWLSLSGALAGILGIALAVFGEMRTRKSVRGDEEVKRQRVTHAQADRGGVAANVRSLFSRTVIVNAPVTPPKQPENSGHGFKAARWVVLVALGLVTVAVLLLYATQPRDGAASGSSPSSGPPSASAGRASVGPWEANAGDVESLLDFPCGDCVKVQVDIGQQVDVDAPQDGVADFARFKGDDLKAVNGSRLMPGLPGEIDPSRCSENKADYTPGVLKAPAGIPVCLITGEGRRAMLVGVETPESYYFFVSG
ncbi:hypothetical protein [Streptomyces griseoruber]|uniref:hypothetical protein n=1 Tax=Streptomyces griseoruber TaxID=1943 RepID=UPI0012FF3557|nr:hypothetical protein [Streptomyces griseoruber]